MRPREATMEFAMNIVHKNQPVKDTTALARDWDPFRMMRDFMRWDPFREMAPMSTGFVPSVDVKETAKEYVFKADVPGLKEQDLEISLTGNRLTIGGKREEEKKTEKDTYYALERSYGSFSRAFTLPAGVDLDAVTADLTQGVLTVTVPKKAEVQPRKVNVQPPPDPKAAKA